MIAVVNIIIHKGSTTHRRSEAVKSSYSPASQPPMCGGTIHKGGKPR